MTSNRNTRFTLWARLLIFSSLAPLVAMADENTGELQITVDEGLVSLAARNAPLQDVVREIAAQHDLRLVQHVALDRLVSIEVDDKTLPDLLDEIFGDESYQLYRAIENDDPADANDPIPGSLWIFSEGSALAPAATAYFEIVMLEGEVGEKQEAILNLGRLGTPEAIQALSLALGDEDPRVRKAALEALSQIGGDEALAAIASASVHDDPRARADATYAMAMVDGYSSIEYLNLALHDENPMVRSAAIDSLGDIGDERAISVIQQALQDPDPTVRERALDVINEINDDAAFRALFPAD
ncbi:MAG: HEAT repeat domain-containing protein [Gammaproteobacteria bacterium]|nr:HEAT repeat domain-containing protein [Gammaproteobacteria bacterium]